MHALTNKAKHHVNTADFFITVSVRGSLIWLPPWRTFALHETSHIVRERSEMRSTSSVLRRSVYAEVGTRHFRLRPHAAAVEVNDRVPAVESPDT